MPHPETISRSLRVNDIELHVTEAGPTDGRLVILLHGFPDFWWGWRHQIEYLAAQGFHVVAPDLRGYNLSNKPKGVSFYTLDRLTDDVIAIADAYQGATFHLAGHDWGGVVAWWVAARAPDRVKQLVILNAPHPDVFPRYIRRHIRQVFKSTYVGFFQVPWLPELALKAARFALLRRALTRSSRAGTFSPEDLERYTQSWAQQGALTAMLNYYRALALRAWQRPARIQSSTLIIWGKQDLFLETGLVKASLKLCNRGQSLFIDNAGHWVQLEAAEAVNTALKHHFERN